MLPNCCFHIGIKSESWKFLNGILNFDSECTNSFTLQPKKAKKCFKKVNCKHPILSSEYALLTKRVWSKWLDTGRIRLCIICRVPKKCEKKKMRLLSSHFDRIGLVKEGFLIKKPEPGKKANLVQHNKTTRRLYFLYFDCLLPLFESQLLTLSKNY